MRAAGGSQREAQGGNEQASTRQRSPPLQPAPVVGTLLTICGGPHLVGDSGKARERYARTLCHDQDIEMISVEDRAPKKARTEDELITFSEDDAQHVRFPHSDSLVMDVQIANMMVKMVLVDTGSSVNILYKSSLERMKLSVKDLEPCNQTIYGFSGEGLAPTGSIRLQVTAGTAPVNRTLLTTFIVVDCPSTYNAIIGRPISVDLQPLPRYGTWP